MWRAGSLTYAGRRNRIHEQLSRKLADGIEVIVVVPIDLIDLILVKQIGIVRERLASVEMENL